MFEFLKKNLNISLIVKKGCINLQKMFETFWAIFIDV